MRAFKIIGTVMWSTSVVIMLLLFAVSFVVNNGDNSSLEYIGKGFINSILLISSIVLGARAIAGGIMAITSINGLRRKKIELQNKKERRFIHSTGELKKISKICPECGAKFYLSMANTVPYENYAIVTCRECNNIFKLL